MCLIGGTVDVGCEAGDSRTPYIPLLMSPRRQALSPSGTLSYLQSDCSCMFTQPIPGSTRNKDFPFTSGIMRGHWPEQKLQHEQKQMNCLKNDIYIHTQLFIFPSMSAGPAGITPWPSCSRKPCPAHFGDNGGKCLGRRWFSTCWGSLSIP